MIYCIEQHSNIQINFKQKIEENLAVGSFWRVICSHTLSRSVKLLHHITSLSNTSLNEQRRKEALLMMSLQTATNHSLAILLFQSGSGDRGVGDEGRCLEVRSILCLCLMATGDTLSLEEAKAKCRKCTLDVWSMPNLPLQHVIVCGVH